MNKFINMDGLRFTRLTVSGKSIYEKGRTKWPCICDCGSRVIVAAANLRTGNSKSCGCLSSELKSKRAKSHGMSKTKTYVKWHSMKVRCGNIKQDRAIRYVLRGIKVCDRWMKFDEFLKDMGECPEGLTLGRIDNNGDYCPGNCRWETIQQQNNNRLHTRKYTYNGQTKSITEWANEYGFGWHTLARRFNNGWSILDALTIPISKNGRYACIDARWHHANL